jgi:flagellar basal-body rod modification protein FlgD
MIASAAAAANTQNQANSANQAGGTLPSVESQLKMDDFLKLLTSQLQYQDPLEPMKDTEFVAQMASFSSLDQMGALNKNFENFMQNQMDHSVQNYLGKVVTVKGQNGETTGSGLVTAVSHQGGEMKLTVGNREYSPSAVTRVELSNGEAVAPTEPSI